MTPKPNTDEDLAAAIDAVSALTLQSDTRASGAYDVWISALLAHRRRQSFNGLMLAIFMARSLCGILRKDDLRLSETVHDLAMLLVERFSITEKSADLDAALSACQCSIDLAQHLGRIPNIAQLANFHMLLLRRLSAGRSD